MRERKRKLCILAPSHWSAGFGGAEYQLKLLVDVLIAHGGFEITYLARKVNSSFSPSGYSIERIGKRDGIHRYSFLFDARDLLSAFGRIRPELILQRVGCAYTGIVAYYARCNNCKTIWHVAIDTDVCPSLGKFSLNYIFRFLDKKVLEYGINHVHYIIAQTEHQGDLLQQYYGRSPNLIIPNFHPFPHEVFERGKEIRVVWVANLKPVKQPAVFVRMARDLLGMRGVKFIMIGRALNTKWYREMLKEMSALENLEYLGERSLKEVNEVLARAHIFVNTSTYEGFPNTFIQAWMRKVPVVSLNVNPDNIIDRNRIGFFSKTYNQMVKDVARLIQDSKLRHDMGERAQTFAFDNFSMKNAEKIIHILEQ